MTAPNVTVTALNVTVSISAVLFGEAEAEIELDGMRRRIVESFGLTWEQSGLTWEQSTRRDYAPSSLSLETLRRALAEVRGRRPCQCSSCTWLTWQRQVEHLTEFVAGDHVEAFLEYATEGDEANFKELATCLGVPAAKLDEMYQGTVANTRHRQAKRDHAAVEDRP